MNDFLLELAKMQLDVDNREYRLYYTKTGSPICYSMEELDELYLVIDAVQYAAGKYNVVVKDNKIIELDDTVPEKLVPGNIGTSTLPNNVMVIADTDYCWELKQCY